MSIRNLSLFAMAAAVLFLNACGSDPHRIDPAGNDGLVTTGDINPKDWQIAAEKSINSIVESGVLNRNDGRKSVIMVSQVKNSTTQHINTRILTDKIRQALLRTGKAVTTTAVGGEGPDDAASKQVRDLRDSEMFDQKTVQQMGTAVAPDMSLAGEIVQEKYNEGRTRESYYFFHMTLTDLKTGLAVWEDNAEVLKQGTRPALGF